MRLTLRSITRLRTPALLGCCILALLQCISPLGVFTQNKHPQLPDDVREAKIKYAKGLSPAVRKVRKLLQDSHVPLEATDLFSVNWYRKVSTYSGMVPDLTRTRTRGNRLKGVEVADTLILPEKVDLDGDTLIIARQVIFSGKHVVIKGNHDMHFFQSAPLLSTNDGVQAREFTNGLRFQKAGFSPAKSIESAIQQGLLVKPETVSISVDGYGRDEWLEDQKRKKQKNPAGLRAAHARGSLQGPPPQNGADKTGEGRKGDDGDPAQTPGQAPIGEIGNCVAGHPDGYIGNTGVTPFQAGTGHTGGTGDNADPGGTLTFKVNFGDPFMSFSAHGGKGQKGGQGGDGGFPSVGGQGGQGGPGAQCDCNLYPRSGNGGQGGRGGIGGQGGNGGTGGPGGQGGNGGTINLMLPCDYTNYATNVTAGAPGPGGDPGHYRPGGAAGSPGPPGVGATNSNCPFLGGGTGPTGQQGDPGPPGDYDGDPGASGPVNDNVGSVNPQTYGNCGGGGGGGSNEYADISPSGYGDGCTNYDYVWIHCDYYADEEEAALTRKYASTIKANHYARALLGRAPMTWECYEVDRWYAGCF